MKLLLTGAGGFIGKALLPALRDAGHDVTLLVRGPLAEPFPQIISPADGWADAVRGRPFDACLHLAWIATPGIYLNSPENPVLARQTAELAESLFQSGLPHFLGLGTCIEYAPGVSAPCLEDATPTAPASPYGQAKHQAHLAVAEAAARHGAGYSWGRLFYPFGPGEHPSRIPSTFLRTLAAGQPLTLKTPDSVKDWIHIQDVVGALLLILRAGPQGAINLGTGTGIPIIALARLAADLTGAAPDLVRREDPPASDPYAYHVADASKLRALGWTPAWTPAAGLGSLLSGQ